MKNEKIELKKNIYDILKYNIKYNDEIKKIVNEYIKGNITIECMEYYINNEFKYNEYKCESIIKRLKKLSKYEKYNSEGMPLLSIIIPTYNRSEFLQQIIENILQQNYYNIEIIIIDDCSTDNTEQIIKTIYNDNEKIKYHRNTENKGPGRSRLKGFNSCINGKYVLFIDDDDLLLDKNYFVKAINLMEIDNNLSFVSPNSLIHDIENNSFKLEMLNFPRVMSGKFYLLNFQSQQYPKPHNAIFKVSKLKQAGFEQINIINDTTIYLRALLYGDAGFLNEVVYLYRFHGGNITFNCDSNFIIENLNEKLAVKNIAINELEYSVDEMELWLIEQIFITIDYYFKNSRVSIRDNFNIIYWIINNIKSNKTYTLEKILKRVVANIIKNVRKVNKIEVNSLC